MCAMGDIFLPKLIPGKILGGHLFIQKSSFRRVSRLSHCRRGITQRKLVVSMGVSKTTIHHWIVALTICVHCNSRKPVLTEENKVARLVMALHFRDPQDLTKYLDMCDWIHLDEKWFFLTWEKERRRDISFSQRRKPRTVC